MHSWIQMLQQLPQASHSLKNLLEEEWNFTKIITPYIRGGEAQSGKLFWSVTCKPDRCVVSQCLCGPNGGLLGSVQRHCWDAAQIHWRVP